MKKTDMKQNYRLLVENILKGDLVSSNDILSKILEESEAAREDAIEKIVLEQSDAEIPDDEGAVTTTAEEEAAAQQQEGSTENAETAVEDDDGEPDDNDTDLGDDLADATGATDDDLENKVGEGKLTELGNDEVEINCEINRKMITIYSDKLANLKTRLNSMGLEKQERQYVTFEANITYYSNKLRELQEKCEITHDQNEVKDRLDIIDNAIKTLESQITAGGEGDVPPVETTEELNDGGEENAETTTTEEPNNSEEETEVEA